MKRLLLAIVAGLACEHAAAQEHVDFTLSWLEVIAGTNTPIANPNGILEPGEAARLSISVAFSPPVGTITTYPMPPPPGIGIVAGFGGMWEDLVAAPGGSPIGAARGKWTFIHTAPGFALGGSGTPTGGGAAVMGIGAGQFILPGGTPNPANPIPNIWTGVWTPDSFEPRATKWLLHSTNSNKHLRPWFPHETRPYLLLQYGMDPGGNFQYVAKFVPGTYGSTTIPIIPAPASLLAVSALFLQRRRRDP